MTSIWFSVVVGGGIGVAYVLASLLMNRLAARDQQRFLLIALGGVGARIGVAILAITLVLVLMPVNAGWFIGAFFSVFLVGIVAEVVLLHRMADTLNAAADPSLSSHLEQEVA